MKKIFFVYAAMLMTVFLCTSFKNENTSLALYPELETYFESIDMSKLDEAHLTSLVHIKDYIQSSNMDHEDWNLIFYCSENTFRSQAAQVFAQTLCNANKFRRMKIFSAGLTSGEINPALIEYFSKIGYKVKKTEKAGKVEYELKFSDKADPILLYSKTIEDPTLPKKIVTSVIVCDIKKETDCSKLQTETNPVSLAFEKVLPGDNSKKVESTLRSIAAEMLFVTKK